MLGIIEGDQGSGKTLLLVRKFLVTVKKRPAMQGYGTFFIDHPNWHVVPWSFIFDPDAPPGFYGADEAPRALDSRKSMSLPAWWTASLSEERKNAREVWLTAQSVDMLDSRSRGMAAEVRSVRGVFPTKREYDKLTDEIVKREHPRVVLQRVWRGRYAARMAPTLAFRPLPLPWSVLRKYAERYDTTQTVALADHIASQKNPYADRKVSDVLEGHSDSRRPDVGVRSGGQRTGERQAQPSRSGGGRHRSDAGFLPRRPAQHQRKG